MTFKHPRFQQGEMALEVFFNSYDIGDGNGNTYWQNEVNAGYGPHTINSMTPSNSTLYAVPLWAGARPFFIKQYGIMVYSISVSGFALTIGIYEDTWNVSRDFRYPGVKVCDFQVTNVTTIGFKSTTLSTPKKLNAHKLYWAAIMKDSVGSCTIGGTGNSRYPILHKCVDWSWPTIFFNQLYIATTYGATLPDPFPASATEDRFSFGMWIREPNQNGT